jgi:hypothetical protein
MASKQEFKSILKRSKFVCDCLLDSLQAAEELMLMTEEQRSEILRGAELAAVEA